jgi:TRAP-type C4-dicarboxylate transport system substrate-binding protein
MDRHFLNLFEEEGYLHLGWADIGFVYIFSRKPVRSAAEMTDARMWVWAGDPLAEIFFGAFGVSPIPLAVPDVLTSLQTGIIDAVYASPLACLALQWFTRIRYVTDVPVTHSLGAALVSKKALRRVDPADVETLIAVARPLLRELTEKTRLQNGEAIEVMKKEGVQVLAIGDETRAEFFRTGRRAWGEGVGRLYSRDLLERVKSVLEKHRHRPP